MVRDRIAELFGRDPSLGINPDEVVAHGAAIQAASLAGTLDQATRALGTAPTMSIPAAAVPGTRTTAPLPAIGRPPAPATPPVGAPPPVAGPPPIDLPSESAHPELHPAERGVVEGRAAAPAAHGGAHAAQQMTAVRPLLMDVNPATLRIATAGGWSESILDKNAPIPIERTKVFTTAHDNQTRVIIDCGRGEERKFVDNEALGTLQLDGLKPRLRGESQIEVTFRVDADGILHVRAHDKVTGTKAEARLNVLGAPVAEGES